MRLISLFGGIVEVTIAMLFSVIISVSSFPEIYSIAIGNKGFVSLFCSFLLLSLPGIPLSILLNTIGLWIHRRFPTLNDWVDSDYLETGIVNRFLMQPDTIINAFDDLRSGLRRIRFGFFSPRQVYLTVTELLQGLIGFAYIIFIIAGILAFVWSTT